MLTELLTYARMKQRDAVTRQGSRRRATNILDARTQHGQQQQQQSVKQESATAPVMTRHRTKRFEETNEGEHLVESRTQTRRTKAKSQTYCHEQIAANNKLVSGGEEPEEQLVETRARTQSAAKESIRAVPQTEKTATECKVKRRRQKTEQLTEAKNQRKRTNKQRQINLSNKRSTETQIVSDEQVHLEPKEPQQTGSDSKNTPEIQPVSESQESDGRLAETKTQIRREKEPIHASVQTEGAAKDQTSAGTVADKTSRRGRTTQTTADQDVKNICSENSRESDVYGEKTLKNDDTAVTATLSDPAKQTRRSKMSASSKKPESEPDPLSVSSERYLSPEDSVNTVKSSCKEQASGEDVEDDAETQWHEERRSNMTRSLDDAVILPVTCGCSEAELVLNRLESGSRGACVRQTDGSWLTPNEFQLISGRGNAKDWKRSIRHHGHSLKSLVEEGFLSLASPPLCICEHCDVQVSDGNC